MLEVQLELALGGAERAGIDVYFGAGDGRLYVLRADGTLRFKRRWWGLLGSQREEGPAPTASIPEATTLAHQFGDKMEGTPFSLLTETIFNIRS